MDGDSRQQDGQHGSAWDGMFRSGEVQRKGSSPRHGLLKVPGAHPLVSQCSIARIGVAPSASGRPGW